MKTHGKSVKRWLSILLCCMLLLLPLGMTAGAVQEEGPEYQEDLSRSMYITYPDYGLDRTGTKQSPRLKPRQKRLLRKQQRKPKQKLKQLWKQLLRKKIRL